MIATKRNTSFLVLVFVLNCVAFSVGKYRLKDLVHEIEDELVTEDVAYEEIPQGGNSKNAEDFLITSLPGLAPADAKTLRQYAGEITVDKRNNGNIFYWLFHAANNSDTAPLIIWLNGGPGCSSMEGLFTEMGPLNVDESGRVTLNKYSWHHNANVVFVDQPVGTGLSYVDKEGFINSYDEVAKSFYNFLIQFLQRHSNFVHQMQSRDIYFFGESTAGRYIPMITSEILKQNHNLTSGNLQVNVKGIGIGSGWIHPYTQYDISEYAHGIGLISKAQLNLFQVNIKECRKCLSRNELLNDACSSLSVDVTDNAKQKNGLNLNYYDVRRYTMDINKYPSDLAFLIKYLNRKDVRNSINAKTTLVYKDCNDDVYYPLQHEEGMSVLNLLPKILDSSIRILLYNGQYDLIVNHIGTENLIKLLKWKQSRSYFSASRFTWSSSDTMSPSGYVQSGGGLTFAVIANSGHMVPQDVPQAAYDLANRFISNRSLNDIPELLTRPSNMKVLDLNDVADDSLTAHEIYDFKFTTLSFLLISVGIAVCSALLTGAVVFLIFRSRSCKKEGTSQG